MDVKLPLALREENRFRVSGTKWTKEGGGNRRLDTVM
jgi:hypothetical protein